MPQRSQPSNARGLIAIGGLAIRYTRLLPVNGGCTLHFVRKRTAGGAGADGGWMIHTYTHFSSRLECARRIDIRYACNAGMCASRRFTTSSHNLHAQTQPISRSGLASALLCRRRHMHMTHAYVCQIICWTHTHTRTEWRVSLLWSWHVRKHAEVTHTKYPFNMGSGHTQ